MNACECARANCPTDDALDAYEDCIDLCNEDFGGYEYDYNGLKACEDACGLDLDIAEAACKADCGVRAPVRTIIGYRCILTAAWADIPRDPRFSGMNEEISSSLESSSVIEVPDWQLSPEWIDRYNEKNTCFGIRMTVFYSDRTACTFTKWLCRFLG